MLIIEPIKGFHSLSLASLKINEEVATSPEGKVIKIPFEFKCSIAFFLVIMFFLIFAVTVENFIGNNYSLILSICDYFSLIIILLT